MDVGCRTGEYKTDAANVLAQTSGPRGFFWFADVKQRSCLGRPPASGSAVSSVVPNEAQMTPRKPGSQPVPGAGGVDGERRFLGREGAVAGEEP